MVLLLFTAMVMCGLIRLSIALCNLINCGLVWPFMAWPFMAWPCYGLKLHFMASYGRMLSFLAVIDPNSFGLVFVRLGTVFGR